MQNLYMQFFSSDTLAYTFRDLVSIALAYFIFIFYYITGIYFWIIGWIFIINKNYYNSQNKGMRSHL